MFDPNDPTKGIIPALPQANPLNSGVVQSLTLGKPYAETMTQQATTPFGQQPGSLPGDQFNASYTKPDGSVVQGYNNSALPGQKPFGSGVNDSSMTDSLNRAINTTQENVGLARSLSSPTESPATTSALPGQLTEDQMKQFAGLWSTFNGGNKLTEQKPSSDASKLSWIG